MQRETRQRMLLVVFFGGLLVTAGSRVLWLNPGIGREEHVSDLRPMVATRRAPDGARLIRGGDRVATLGLTRLDAVRPQAVAGRDPWRFVDPVSRRSETRRAAESSPVRLPENPPSQPVASPPELGMEYLGNFGPSEKRIAVFSDGRRVWNALEGEVLDGRFRLASIGYESVEIELMGFPDRPLQRLSVRRRSL